MNDIGSIRFNIGCKRTVNRHKQYVHQHGSMEAYIQRKQKESFKAQRLLLAA